MTSIFQTVLQMSITGSFVILFICVFRTLLKGFPKIYSYVLWALVLFRLLCPVTITSNVSLVPQEIARSEIRVSESVEIPEKTEMWENQSIEPVVEYKDMPLTEDWLNDSSAAMKEQQPNLTLKSTPDIQTILSCIWLVGIILLVFYSIFSLVRIYGRVEISICKEGNVYIAQDIDTPFTLGIFAPKIYLPMGLMEKEASYIIAHEKYHIKRCDHIIKIVAFFTLCIHWFNPLVWLAFVLAGKDMEMSCDEAVMKEFPEDIRQEYSASLLNLTTGRKIIAMAPLAFGEGNVKERIKNVMNYKRPVFWITIVGVIVCVVLAVCLVTDPGEDVVSEDIVASESVLHPEIEEPEPSSEVLPIATPESAEAPIAQPDDELPEFVEKEISVFYSDLTWDGIDERIVLSIDVLPEDEVQTDLKALLQGAYLAKVSVHRGLGGDSYAEDAIWSFNDISTSRPGNYQLSLIEKYERNYLLISSIQEQQGTADYRYEVISLTEEGEEMQADEYAVSFKFAETQEAASAPWQTEDFPIRSEVVPDFRQHLYEWYDEDGVLLIATDVNLWEEDMEWVVYSTEDAPVWYIRYYASVFDRQDYYTLAGKTMFKTKYFTLELPEEWAGKVHVEESDDGKSVQLYHTKTSELEHGFGLLGTIFLATQEEALVAMEMVPERYIGEAFVAEDGVTYMPMSAEPTDVQSVPETAEEYYEMSSYFSDGRIGKYVWVTENGTWNNPLWALANEKEYYPQYGLMGYGAADLGQKLLWQGFATETVLFDSDGEHHTLVIGDKDYSPMLEGAFYLENIGSSWYAVVDLDRNDESREIMIFDDGPSGDPHLNVLSIRDGKLSYLGSLGILAFTSAFQIHGDGTITILERTWSPENNVVEKTYKMQDGSFVEVSREEYVYLYLDFHKVIQDLVVYKEKDLASETVTLKAEEAWICFNKVFSSSEEGERFYEIETLEGGIYYLYSDGWLDDYVADLSHAG